jgi:hypothetical protein
VLITIGFQTNPPIFCSLGNLLIELLMLPNECSTQVKEYSEIFQMMFMHSADIVSEFNIRELVGASLIIAIKLFQYHNPGDSMHQANLKVLKMLSLEKESLIRNLKFLRDFVSCFKESFGFSCLNEEY